MEIIRLARKLLGPPEEIGGHNLRASRHRWTIFGNHHFKLYLYRFIGDGGSGGNDYPRRFISVSLVKSNGEETAQEPEAFPDPAVWMLLIGKPSQDQENSPHTHT